MNYMSLFPALRILAITSVVFALIYALLAYAFNAPRGMEISIIAAIVIFLILVRQAVKE